MSDDGAVTPDLDARLRALSPEKQALLARALAARATARGDAGVIAPREGSGAAPLSYAQELLWLYEQMTPGTAAYNVPIARRVRGALDEATLARSLDALVARHESLRTRFIEAEGVPRQVADAPRSVPIEVHDLRSQPDDDRERAADGLMRTAAARPFDLAAGTWPRVVLIRLADADALLLIVVHHVVFDGGSIGVLFRDLAAIYAALSAGTPPALAPQPIQLADYAAWERRELDDARLAPIVAYWRNYLAGTPAAVELPTDLPRPSGATGTGARYAATLDRPVLDAARALAAANGVTLFVVLLGAFQALVYRYSDQPDVVVGTAVAGRSRQGTEALVGYLASRKARF